MNLRVQVWIIWMEMLYGKGNGKPNGSEGTTHSVEFFEVCA